MLDVYPSGTTSSAVYVIEKALAVGGVTAMKDPTRGGLANCINEMARKSGVGVLLQDDAIPVREEVKAVSDMLGIDPYEVANEGKVLMGVKADKAEEVLAAIKTDKYGKNDIKFVVYLKQDIKEYLK